MKLLIAGLLAAIAGPVLAYTVPAILPVYAVSAGRTGVTVRVPPSGCTAQKSDLTVAVTKTQDRPILLITRRRPNDSHSCASAAPADITWRYEDLGLEPGKAFSLANPLIADPAGEGK